jgi:hypothetical protein
MIRSAVHKRADVIGGAGNPPARFRRPVIVVAHVQNASVTVFPTSSFATVM